MIEFRRKASDRCIDRDRAVVDLTHRDDLLPVVATSGISGHFSVNVIRSGDKVKASYGSGTIAGTSIAMQLLIAD